MIPPDAPRADAAESVWVRHLERGSEYEVLAQAQVQAAAPVSDDDLVMVYRGRDGLVWVQPTDEFCDGRFELCSAPAPGPAPGPAPTSAALAAEVIAAARAWRHGGGRDEMADLRRAVDAYDAALPQGGEGDG